ncbi:MAG: hypothetical protein R3C45_13255 [Phycisphaerales bacterium]
MSSWCLIRFYSDKKANRAIDFLAHQQRLDPADGNMADVVKVIEEKQAGGDHSWFGSPRDGVTVEGKPQIQTPPTDQ